VACGGSQSKGRVVATPRQLLRHPMRVQVHQSHSPLPKYPQYAQRHNDVTPPPSTRPRPPSPCKQVVAAGQYAAAAVPQALQAHATCSSTNTCSHLGVTLRSHAGTRVSTGCMCKSVRQTPSQSTQHTWNTRDTAFCWKDGEGPAVQATDDMTALCSAGSCWGGVVKQYATSRPQPAVRAATLS
jgi:hypothetical protein